MNTLIIPCAGRSSRFPGMRPKFLLTHPDGKLMLQKALDGICRDVYDRIIITIVRTHAELYDAEIIVRQIFEGCERVELCVLGEFTASPAETIYRTLKQMDITGAVTIKDVDNRVKVQIPQSLDNAVVCCSLGTFPEIRKLAAKSFLVVDKQGMITRIAEKEPCSSNVVVGIYCWEDADTFCRVYAELTTQRSVGKQELFLSQLVSHAIDVHGLKFRALWAEEYEDYGTLDEWRDLQQRMSSYWVDFDGVLIRNSGKFGRVNWHNNTELLTENVELLRNLQARGAQIIITTSRPESMRAETLALLRQAKLEPCALVMGLNHSPRIMINDFSATNPYPSCHAISVPRNASLSNYLP